MNTQISEGTVHEVLEDLQEAIAANPKALEVWEALTTLARNEWICWNITVNQAETRKHHIHRTDKAVSPSVQGILAKRSMSHKNP